MAKNEEQRSKSQPMSLFKDVGPEALDALAGKCWLVRRNKDPRLSALINAARGGSLTFEELAESMWHLGFITGTKSVMAAVDGRIAESRALPEVSS